MKASEKIIEHLLQKGCKEISCKSKKYRQFVRPNRDDFYFVGKAGALRAGKTASNTISLTRFVK